MSHRRIHLLEKLQVELAAAAAAVAVYFLLAPGLASADPELPVTFVPAGAYGRLLLLGGMVWLVSAACSAVTVSARPEGGIVAALIGAAGISLYSPPIRALLWRRQDDLAGMFAQLRLEVLLLSIALLGVLAVVGLVRGLVAYLRPKWLWRSPLAELSAAEGQKALRAPGGREKSGELDDEGTGSHGDMPGGIGFVGLLLALAKEAREAIGFPPADPTAEPEAKQKSMLRNAGFFGVGLLLSVVLLLLLMRSADRGQILFAMLVSFLVGVLVAHQAFPTRHGILMWGIPLASAVILYTLAGQSAIAGDPRGWMHVPDYSRALPVDWLTAGNGGAVLGYWISERIHEARHIEKQEDPASPTGRSEGV